MSASVRPRQADNPSFVLSTWEQREKAQREAFVDDEPEFEISEEVPHAASSEIEDLKKYCVPFRSPSASIRSTFVEGVDPLWGGIEQDNSNDLMKFVDNVKLLQLMAQSWKKLIMIQLIRI
eukprot:TRINITY_DN7070_c0_g1_i1.p1 TRINITY_DN7070_c0_g1~~TRINITY_DN7070_c0_g1_i1.p1  ORF type:complete len:121 (-),score=24.50 TRINITY_DN7070_c0_g1_i1:400-762(-)